MKKIILSLMLLTACVSTEIKEIDGCQYIETTSYSDGSPVVSLTHKGDCDNPIHKDNGYLIYKHLIDSIRTVSDTTKK
jgi:hypothetical protein